MFKVIVAGGREFNDFPLLCEKLDKILSRKMEVQIVSGAQRGADTLGEDYAKLRGYDVKRFPADWDTFRKKAGPIRNGQMADYAEALVAFWDGKSTGTFNMIQQATQKGLIVRVVRYEIAAVRTLEPLEVGDKVRTNEWGKALDGRIHTVTEFIPGQICETGIMIRIDGYPRPLSRAWLFKV